ncbi:MAG: methyltransferase domain-containing protein [Spirochaetaceae bacterium]|jgi:SAM-dependent methyltransferase|nr:methyltransferase domain-containing protein [Spirochaetaceae bacterium]
MAGKESFEKYSDEWFNDRVFWEQYAPIMFDAKRWAEVSAVADGITRMARLPLYEYPPAYKSAEASAPGGPRAADMCCGFGRISLELARRGFAVTGVDLTPAYLDTARDDAAYEHLEIEFVCEDVRRFKRPRAFDLAVNLYISFGYFASREDDMLFARNVCESLKDGACFIIETLGKEIAVRDFAEAEWFERAGYFVLTKYEATDSWEGLKNRWILIDKDGKKTERVFTQRLYAATELRRLLLDAGFSAVELYGNWEEGPYDQYAESLIAVGRK